MTKKTESQGGDPSYRLGKWAGEFGDRYIERNSFADWMLEPGVEGFRRMVGGLDLKSILEVGCNVGLNLTFLDALFKGRVDLYAVEPNPNAHKLVQGRTDINLKNVFNCDAFDIPMEDGSVDLAFTSGVLIHIHPDDLPRATDEIVRVSRRYVLCSEYFSHMPEEKPYHSESGLLFKRDFGDYYAERFPELECVGYGFLWMREFRLFDNLNWWLFEKKDQRG